MATSYSVIYDGVIRSIQSYSFIENSIEDIYETLSDYLKPALARFSPLCQSDLFDRDDSLGEFNFDMLDIEIEIIVRLMVCEYLKANFMYVPTLLKTILPGKDFHFFSPGNHLKEIRATIEEHERETTRMITLYTYTHKKSEDSGETKTE